MSVKNTDVPAEDAKSVTKSVAAKLTIEEWEAFEAWRWASHLRTGDAVREAIRIAAAVK